MSTKNLLVELFVEELPPKALKKIGDAFAQTLQASLQAQGLLSQDCSLTAYASPRRLGVHLSKVAAQAADRAVSQKLMPVSVGLNPEGKPTPALLKKLSALGADESALPSLKREHDGKAELLYFNSVAKGATLSEGLQKALEDALSKLPIPKVMNYQLADGWTSVDFVRPAHALLALHGSDVVNVAVLGLKAGNVTRGHRFEAKTDTIVIREADSYAAQLAEEGAVIPGFAERRAEIVRQLQAAAVQAGDSLKPIEDEALLDEVTGLVERPNVLVGQFEEAFLEVPQECLILTMKANQKYFPLVDNNGKLSNKFLIVSNIRPVDPSAVIGGNERVVRPRLADAKFFFDQDRKKTLESRVALLDKVVYHNKLGTQGQRMERVRAIARTIGGQLGGEALSRQADQAAMLAKADLVTDMVGEFPELQGIMGRYYALHDKLPSAVADAIEDHYKPRFAGDALPREQVGIVVALADKLETLIGLFGIGNLPSGDKDPFALRRHALGVIRMLIEKDLPLALDALLNNALTSWLAAAESQQVNALAGVEENLPTFIYDRLAVLLREQGYSAQEVDAVLALRPQRLSDVTKRLAAVRAFAALPEAEALAAANKRITNILKKTAAASGSVQINLLQETAEQNLHKAIQSLKPEVESAFAAGDFAGNLKSLARLRDDVDAFFNNVMVMAEDEKLRANRLALLSELHGMMNRVADISKLAA